MLFVVEEEAEEEERGDGVGFVGAVVDEEDVRVGGCVEIDAAVRSAACTVCSCCAAMLSGMCDCVG